MHLFACERLHWLIICTSPLRSANMTQGTKGSGDFFFETFSLPECKDFFWELIPDTAGSPKNVLLWLAVFEDGNQHWNKRLCLK